MADVHIRPARPADAAAIAQIHLAVQQAAYAGILPAALLAQADLARVTADKRQKLRADADGRSHTLVAIAPDRRPVGYAACGPRRDGPGGCPGELFNQKTRAWPGTRWPWYATAG